LGPPENIILLVLSIKEPGKILIFFIKSELFKRLWRRQSNDNDGGGGDNKVYPAHYLTIIRQCIWRSLGTNWNF